MCSSMQSTLEYTSLNLLWQGNLLNCLSTKWLSSAPQSISMHLGAYKEMGGLTKPAETKWVQWVSLHLKKPLQLSPPNYPLS